MCGQVLLVTSLTYPSLWVLPSGEQHLTRAEDGYIDPDKVQVAAPAPRAPRASPCVAGAPRSLPALLLGWTVWGRGSSRGTNRTL